MYLNRQEIIANCGSEPELRYTPTGIPICNFRVAVNNSYTGKDGERKTETEWFSIVTYKRMAESCNQYLHKGSKVYVEGKTKTRSWEGPDGQKKYRTEVHARQVIFLDKRSGEQRGGVDEEIKDGDADIDDLPF